MDSGIVEQMMDHINNTRGYDKKTEREFSALILEYPDTAAEVFNAVTKMGLYNREGRRLILITLNKAGKGGGLAAAEARRLAYELEFKDISPKDEESIKKWLACESDAMPEKMLRPRSLAADMYASHNRQYVWMSKVCEYTARQCVYALKTGLVDRFKYPVREMLAELGEEYTKNFIDNAAANYGIAEEELMRMFSAIYAVGSRTKKETEFYGKYIDKWLAEDAERYTAAIYGIKDLDVGKKIIRKIFSDKVF